MFKDLLLKNLKTCVTNVKKCATNVSILKLMSKVCNQCQTNLIKLEKRAQILHISVHRTGVILFFVSI